MCKSFNLTLFPIKGKAADSFIMILEGRVQVTVGKEKLMYEAGPFTIFGNDFLLNDQLGGNFLIFSTF